MSQLELSFDANDWDVIRQYLTLIENAQRHVDLESFFNLLIDSAAQAQLSQEDQNLDEAQTFPQNRNQPVVISRQKHLSNL